MIPKYPNSVEWFLIDRHFSKQLSDQNDDHGPHGTGRHNTSNTHLLKHTNKLVRTHAITQVTHTHQRFPE